MATKTKKADVAPVEDVATEEEVREAQASYKHWLANRALFGASRAEAAAEQWNMESGYVAREVARLAPRVLAHRAAILSSFEPLREQPFISAHMDRVVSLAGALRFVAARSKTQQVVVKALSSAQMKALVDESAALRELSFKQAPLLVSMGVMESAELEQLRAGGGLLDRAEDLEQLSAQFSEHWAKLGQVQSALFAQEAERLTPERVARMGQVGAALAAQVGQGVDPALIKGVNWRDELRVAQYLLRTSWHAILAAATYHLSRSPDPVLSESLIPVTAMRKRG